MKRKILIVQDDINISNILKWNLNYVNYDTSEAFNRLQALNFIQKERFDLILLDIMLSKADRFELMEKLLPYNVPIIIITSKDTIIDKVKGLKLGAEDYLVKPFENLELFARIEKVLKRRIEIESIKFKNIQVFINKREVLAFGKPVSLTVKEFELLVYLLRNKNIALSREQFLNNVWGISYFGETRTVDVHIKSLRKKLNLHDQIKTVYKIGYSLED